jgi:hypothetical protein
LARACHVNHSAFCGLHAIAARKTRYTLHSREKLISSFLFAEDQATAGRKQPTAVMMAELAGRWSFDESFETVLA